MRCFTAGECALTGGILDVELDILRWMTLMKHEDLFLMLHLGVVFIILKIYLTGARYGSTCKLL